MGKKDGKHSNSDAAALFEQAVQGARPLKGRKRHPAARKPPPPVAASRKRDERLVLDESLEDAVPEAELETGDELSFRREGVRLDRFRKLRRGEFAIQDQIDLHGLNSREARAYLREFVSAAVADGLRCVRVVHGKGRGSGARGPVLKHGVNRWLRQWDEVLAFCSAREVHGGTGAVYVLLRRT